MVFYPITRLSLLTITTPPNKSMKPSIAMLLGLFVLISVTSRAQYSPHVDTTGAKRGPYNLVITVGGGISYYPKHIGIPATLEQTNNGRWGVPFTIRAMWYPDHRLRAGIETGWTTLYSYRGRVNGERARVYVSGVPMLLVFSMPLAWLSGTERRLTRRLAITGGTGAYLINSRLNYQGIVDAQEISIGWMVAGSYVQPVGRRVRIATELKWLNATATQDADFSLQLQLLWRAFSW